MDEQRYVVELAVPLYPNASGDRTAARSIALAESVIDARSCDRIGAMCLEFSCSGHDVVCAATLAYIGQLIDQREFAVAFSPDRGAPLEPGASATLPRSTILKIENHADPGESFITYLNRFPRSSGGSSSNCDLALNTKQGKITIAFRMRDDSRAIHVSCTSNNIDDDYASSFANGLVTFIRQVVEAPSRSLLSHKLVAQAQLDRIQEQWGSARSRDPSHCIHELFERQVASTPDNVALEYRDVSLTYAALNRRGNQLAHRIVATLTAQAIRRASCLVGICVDRSVEMAVGLLGIMKAGCAYVPIDLTYPVERQAFLIKDAAITLLLTRQAFIEKFSALGVTILCLDEATDGPRREDETPEMHNIPVADVNLTPHRPAAVLYTSGSTGTPKGVFISHRGLVSRLHWMQSCFPFGKDEIAGHIAQLPFVRALWELFVPLTRGIKVVIVALDTTKDPEKLSQFIATHRITRLVTAPSLAQTLIASAEARHRLGTLRHWFIGGESLHHKVASAIRATLPEVAICNLYGATEVHSYATYYPIENACDGAARVPIGRAIANTAVVILDRHKRMLPMGIQGEICVLGDGVASGYLNQPGLSAEKFTPHDYASSWPGPLYRTGDIGYYLADGNLMFVSRTDHQVKLRGMRVELGEIETVLLAHDDVEKAVVVASESAPGDVRLVAYIVARRPADNPPSQADKRRQTYALRRFLETKLPPYMIPSYFVLLTELPLNAYGKVVRRELPPPDLDSVGSVGYLAPRDEHESLLCAVWEEVLGIPGIGVLDNFFDFGGHSLLASRIKARVDAALSIDLPLQEIFQKPHIGALAETVRALATLGAARLELVRTSDASAIALTEEIKPLEHLLGQTATLAHFCLRAFGAINVGALRASIAQLIGRHDALRMVFTTVDGATRMSPTPHVHVDFRVIDIRDPAVTEGSKLTDNPQLRSTIRNLLSRPFDISSGCLTRWALIQVHAREYVILGIVDHVVVDAPSIVIFKNDLKHLYEAYCNGHAPELPTPTFGYFDYAHWQERYRRTDAYRAGKHAYLGHLQRVFTNVSKIATRQTHQPGSYFHTSCGVDPGTQAAVKDICSSFHMTANMFYTAALHLAVYSMFEHEDILIAMPASDRRFAQLQDVVGLFWYLLHVRSALTGDMLLTDFIARTRAHVIEAQSAGCYFVAPAEIAALADTPEVPIPDIRIAYRHFPGDEPWTLRDLRVEPIELIDRVESAGVPPVGENNARILLRVDRAGSTETISMFGSGLLFSSTSFDEFFSLFLSTFRELARVSNPAVPVAAWLRSKRSAHQYHQLTTK